MSIERSIDEHMLAKVARLREMGSEDESKSRAALGQVGRELVADLGQLLILTRFVLHL
jgi:RNA-binding protein YhbY